MKKELNISSGFASDLFTSPKELGNEVLVSLKYLSERYFYIMLQEIANDSSGILSGYGYSKPQAKMISEEADRVHNSRYPFSEDYSTYQKIKDEFGYLNPSAKIETARLPIKKLTMAPEDDRKVTADWGYDSRRNSQRGLSLPLLISLAAPISIPVWYHGQLPLEGSLLEYVYFELDKGESARNQFKAKTNAAIMLKRESKNRLDEKIRQLKTKTSTMYSFGLGDGSSGGKTRKHLGADAQSGASAWDNLGIHNDQNEY